jgi:molecular chaperone GrpE
MNTAIEFLREKKLLGEDAEKFKIIHDEIGEVILNEIMDEYAKNKSKDDYTRLYAEFENYKKRVQKEKEDLVINTKTKMLNSILDLDNDLNIAKKNIENSEGINIILNKVSNFLKTQGIEDIQTDVYDPDLHEVVSMLQTGEEKIIDVVSKGYTINGKPFRYPKVILSK